MEAQEFSSDRQLFLSFGTIETRKNSHSLTRAFQSLWNAGSEVHLVLAGYISERADEVFAFINRWKLDPRLTFLSQLTDEVIRHHLRRARAVIMPSETEGFGLPPYESVYAGIPAIMSNALPSADLIPAGAIKLENMDPESIANAVQFMMDDRNAAQLWREAAGVQLPTWRSVSAEIAAWVEQDEPRPDQSIGLSTLGESEAPRP